MKRSGEDKPEAAAASVPTEFVCEIAQNGRVLRWNAGWSELVRLISGEAATALMESSGLSMIDLIHADDVPEFTASLGLIQGCNRPVLTVFRLKASQRLSVRMWWSRLQSEGETEAWVGVGRLQQEGQVTKSDAAMDSVFMVDHAISRYSLGGDELARFASAASHDLRAPLRAIHGFSEIVREDYADVLDGTGNDYLKRISNASQKLNKMIDGVTRFLRLDGDGSCFDAVDLNELVREVAAIHASEDAVVPGAVKLKPLPVVHGDPLQLMVLVQELVKNGLVHNQAKTPVVTVARHEPDANCESVPVNQRVAIVVSDNGVGVPTKYHDVIFSPFRKLSPVSDASGLGLGLSLAKRIVEGHGGKLRCLSGEKGGCHFVFDLQLDSMQRK